jgi:hypothetical protein
VNPAEIGEEMRRHSKQLDKGVAALREQAHEYAESENEYRLAHARAYLAHEGPAHERKAAADLATGEERYRAHLADGMKVAALEAVRSRRAQLSALQSMMNANREELGAMRYGQDVS